MAGGFCICLYRRVGLLQDKSFLTAVAHGIDEAAEFSRALPNVPPVPRLSLLRVKSCLL